MTARVFCGACGHQLDEVARFCSACGVDQRGFVADIQVPSAWAASRALPADDQERTFVADRPGTEAARVEDDATAALPVIARGEHVANPVQPPSADDAEGTLVSDRMRPDGMSAEPDANVGRQPLDTEPGADNGTAIGLEEADEEAGRLPIGDQEAPPQAEGWAPSADAPLGAPESDEGKEEYAAAGDGTVENPIATGAPTVPDERPERPANETTTDRNRDAALPADPDERRTEVLPTSVGPLPKVPSIAHWRQGEFCMQCGSKFSPGASFCDECGKARATDTPPPAPAPTPAGGSSWRAPVAVPASRLAGAPQVPPTPSRASKRADAPPRHVGPGGTPVSSGARAPQQEKEPPALPRRSPSGLSWAASPSSPGKPGPSTPPSPPIGARGRLRTAYARARREGDRQVLTSFWLGLGALSCLLLGWPTESGVLAFISLLAAIPAIVTARFARQRGRESGDRDIVYLSRYGQISGWIVVGLFLVLVILLAVFFGSFAGGFAGGLSE